jgi:hypothetical protein
MLSFEAFVEFSGHEVLTGKKKKKKKKERKKACRARFWRSDISASC